MVTSASASEEMVYDAVKTVFDNLEELKGTHAAFRVLSPKAMLKGLTAPFHDGAMKYYKEQGWK